jgi:hypothetical protein
MRCDSLAWARAVRLGKHLYGFKGLNNDLGNGLGAVYLKLDPVTRQLISNEKYMETLYEAEVGIYMSDDWAADWREVCEQQNPRLWKEKKKDYTKRVDDKFNDASARYRWASDRVDFSEMVDWVQSMVTDNTSFAHFLREHPVDSIYSENLESWMSIDDIVGFCPSCDNILTEEDVAPIAVDEDKKHVYASQLISCFCEGDLADKMWCNFDHDLRPRVVVDCGCGFIGAMDDIEGTWTERFGKPIDWPPNAPYPPRRGFAGDPMDVPFYEP